MAKFLQRENNKQRYSVFSWKASLVVSCNKWDFEIRPRAEAEGTGRLVVPLHAHTGSVGPVTNRTGRQIHESLRKKSQIEKLGPLNTACQH